MSGLSVVAVSDLHGYLPSIPECDLLLIAGDISWGDEERFLAAFADWLGDVPASEIVGVAGNHDFYLEANPDVARDLPWTYLQDETVRVDGEVIHGSPYSNWFGEWAFMGDEALLAEKAALIPDDTTILLTHGPPNGIGDYVKRGEHVGSSPFAQRALELPDLKLYVFGHIHEARGEWRQGNATWANVSHVDLTYKPYPMRIAQWDFSSLAAAVSETTP